MAILDVSTEFHRERERERNGSLMVSTSCNNQYSFVISQNWGLYYKNITDS